MTYPKFHFLINITNYQLPQVEYRPTQCDYKNKHVLLIFVYLIADDLYACYNDILTRR